MHFSILQFPCLPIFDPASDLLTLCTAAADSAWQWPMAADTYFFTAIRNCQMALGHLIFFFFLFFRFFPFSILFLVSISQAIPLPIAMVARQLPSLNRISSPAQAKESADTTRMLG